ncbi:MAG: tyrosine recombinase XerC [Clostridia bacterium]|nr:tyrosine recombinase XerC [Clostridia bacterium]
MKSSKTLDHNAPEPLASFLIYIESIQGKSPKTADEYFYDLRTFYRFLNLYFDKVDDSLAPEEIPIDNVNIEMLRAVDLQILHEYMHYLNRTRGNSNRARSRKISSLKSFYKYLCNKVNLIDDNPTTELESVKLSKQLPKHFTLEDSLALLNSVENRNSARDYCMLTLFLNCGMRLAELVNINMTDIHGDTLVVIGKGNKERTIYLNEACLAALEVYLPIRNQQTPIARDKNALFLSERNQRISRRTVQYTVEKYVKKIGLDSHKYTTHKLRHTAATLMYQAGVDIRVLQEILGHKQLSTTEIYTHISNDQMRNAVQNNPLSQVKAPKVDVAE